MEDQAVLNLLLSARYVSNGAFSALSSDINALIKSASGLEALGAGLNLVGDAMIAGSVAVAAGIGEAVRKATAYEQALNRLSAVGSLQAYQQQQFSDVFMKTAEQYGQSSQDIASGSYFVMSALESLGYTANDVLKNNVIQNMAAYVEASGAGAEGSVTFSQAAQDLVHVLGGMQVPIQDWGQAMGDLTVVENAAGLSQQQLISSMLRAAPVASALHENFSDLTAAVGALASSGVAGARAGTELASGLRNALTNSSALKELAKLGINPQSFFDSSGQLQSIDTILSTILPKLSKMNEVGQLSALHTIFGGVGEKAFLELVNANNKYQNLQQVEKGDTQSKMLQTAQAMSDSFAGSLQKLKSAFDDLLITIGQRMLPVIQPIVDRITLFIEQLRTLIASLSPAQLTNLAHAAMLAPLALAGGGIAMKGAGLGVSSFGAFLREDVGTVTETNTALNAWRNQVAKGNVAADLAEFADTSSKRQEFERAAAQWERGYQDLTGRRDAMLESLAREYKAEYNSFGKLFEKQNPKRANVSQVAYDAQKSAFVAAHRRTATLSYKNTQDNAIQYFDQELANLGTFPVEADYLTPFAGPEGALMPLPPNGGKEARTFMQRALLDPVAVLARGGAEFGRGTFNRAIHPLQTGKAIGGAAVDFAKGIPQLAIDGFAKFLDLIKGIVPALRGLITALPELIGGFGAIAAPVLVVVGAITTLVLIFTRYRAQAEDVARYLAGQLAPVFQFFGALVQTIWKVIQQAWENAAPRVDAAMQTLFKAFKDLAPLLEFVGMVIGGVVATILSVISGLVNGFLSALPDIIDFFGSIVKVIGDVFNFVNDLIHGNWAAAWHDFVSIFGDAFDGIFNLFKGILDFIGGFISGIVGFFQTLADVLVGHSIIPDMVLAIVDWFGRLPEMAFNALGSLVTGITTLFSNIWNWVIQGFGTFMRGAGEAIITNLPFIGGPILQVAQTIANFLQHHSPPPMGPMADDNTWMPNMMAMMGQGISANSNLVTDPVNALTGSIASSFDVMKTKAVTDVNDLITQAGKAATAAANAYPATPGGPAIPAGMMPDQAKQAQQQADAIRQQYIDQQHQQGLSYTIFDFVPTNAVQTEKGKLDTATQLYTQYLQGRAQAQQLANLGFTQATNGTWKTIEDFEKQNQTTALANYEAYLATMLGDGDKSNAAQATQQKDAALAAQVQAKKGYDALKAQLDNYYKQIGYTTDGATGQQAQQHQDASLQVQRQNAAHYEQLQKQDKTNWTETANIDDMGYRDASLAQRAAHAAQFTQRVTDSQQFNNMVVQKHTDLRSSLLSAQGITNTAVNSVVQQGGDTQLTTVDGVIEHYKRKYNDGDTAIVQQQATFQQQLTDAINSGAVPMYDAGGNLMSSLAAGISRYGVDVMAAVYAVAQDATFQAHQAFGIHSPSKVFHAIGQYISEGLANGITEGSNRFVRPLWSGLVPTSLGNNAGQMTLQIGSLQVDELHVGNVNGLDTNGTSQQDPASTYRQARAIQAEREANLDRYNRQSQLDASYRYAYQYTA